MALCSLTGNKGDARVDFPCLEKRNCIHEQQVRLTFCKQFRLVYSWLKQEQIQQHAPLKHEGCSILQFMQELRPVLRIRPWIADMSDRKSEPWRCWVIDWGLPCQQRQIFG